MIHICYGLYDKVGRYSKFTGTSMFSIFANTKAEVTVHILHDNTLTEINRERFETVAENYNQRVKFYNVEETCANEIEKLRSKLGRIENFAYSIGSLYRFLILRLIPERKIIYLDSDTIINLDIGELWQIELGDKPLAVVPEIANNAPTTGKLPLCVAGIVKGEDYFNAGVLLLNLERLRADENKIWEGINFIAENPKYTLFDQDVLNYCFSAQALKLPNKFNCLVGEARLSGDFNVGQRICHYISNSVNLNLRDNFNRLWLEYFMKTPWFNAEVLLRIYDCIQELNAQAQTKLIKLSAIMSGKRRIFFLELNHFENFRRLFHAGKAEEIIDATKPDALKTLLKKMRKLKGAGFFVLLVRQYPELEKFLTQEGFIEGADFIDATKFFSYEQGMPLDTYFLIRAI